VQFNSGATRGQHRLDDVSRPGAGGKDMVQIAHGAGHGGIHGSRVQDAIRTGTVPPRFFLRPTIARSDKTQFEQPAIPHGTGTGPDIVRELRTDQYDYRRVSGWTEIRATLAPRHCWPRNDLATTPSCSLNAAGLARA